MIKVKDFAKLPLYIKKGIIYKLGGWLFTPKPRVVVFPVNDRCNSRCIMCNRWRKEIDTEISIEKIREVFSNRLFSEVKEVNIHGGEPTLRPDLAEIFKTIQDSCPKVHRMWLSTNGLNPKRIKRRVEEILAILDFNKIKFMPISVSIDGLKTTHEKIRGVKGGFDQSIETIRILNELKKKYPIEISMSTVIQPLNLYEIDKLEDLADSLSVPIYFIPLMFDKFFNIELSQEIVFSDDDLIEYKKIIKNRCIKDFSLTGLYWYEFLRQMDGKPRNIPCAFDRYIISLYPTGEILPCSQRDWIVYGNIYDNSVNDIWYSSKAKEVRKKMKKYVCPTCSNMCQVEFSLAEEFFTFTKYIFKRRFLPFIKPR
jgi:MoaA/NifB/PqqE/SkfB family radical SAM enzyme